MDFASFRPHLYRNLPKPDSFPVHGCSQNHELYSLCTETTAFGTSKVPKFETEYPFGSSPGFLTNLGIIDVPTVPIGGYIYNGGAGASTSYCLFAEASYKAWGLPSHLARITDDDKFNRSGFREKKTGRGSHNIGRRVTLSCIQSSSLCAASHQYAAYAGPIRRVILHEARHLPLCQRGGTGGNHPVSSKVNFASV